MGEEEGLREQQDGTCMYSHAEMYMLVVKTNMRVHVHMYIPASKQLEQRFRFRIYSQKQGGTILI